MVAGTAAMSLYLSVHDAPETAPVMMRRVAKTLWNRWPLVKAAILVLDDLRWGIRLRRGQIDTDSGATHASLPDTESVRYIEEVFAAYKEYGKIDTFVGSVAEVGPGDNAGVAMLMRRDGCRQVDLVDRFASRREHAKQQQIYDALSAKYQLEWLRNGRSWNDRELAGIVPKIGQSAEQHFKACVGNQRLKYDVIVSRSVLEHLYDPLGALEHMALSLKPGGRMVHKIDLRDHGLFTPQHHELTFLRFPHRLYQLMTRNSGRPNRILFHRYREVCERLRSQLHIEYAVYVTRLTGIGDIVPHQLYEDIPAVIWKRAAEHVDQYRAKCSSEFQSVDSRDLAIAGIFLVMTRA